jgi:hypothetical protein
MLRSINFQYAEFRAHYRCPPNFQRKPRTCNPSSFYYLPVNLQYIFAASGPCHTSLIMILTSGLEDRRALARRPLHCSADWLLSRGSLDGPVTTTSTLFKTDSFFKHVKHVLISGKGRRSWTKRRPSQATSSIALIARSCRGVREAMNWASVSLSSNESVL